MYHPRLYSILLYSNECDKIWDKNRGIIIFQHSLKKPRETLEKKRERGGGKRESIVAINKYPTRSRRGEGKRGSFDDLDSSLNHSKTWREMIVNRACDRERTCVGKKRVVYLYLFPSLVRLVESSPFHLQPRYQPVHTRVTYVTVADWHVCLVTVSRFPPRTLLRYTFLRAVEKRVERERGRKRESRVASLSLSLALLPSSAMYTGINERATETERERQLRVCTDALYTAWRGGWVS